MCDNSIKGRYCGGFSCSDPMDCYFPGCKNGSCVSSLTALVDNSDPNASSGDNDFDNVCTLDGDFNRCIGNACTLNSQCASNYCPDSQASGNYQCAANPEAVISSVNADAGLAVLAIVLIIVGIVICCCCGVFCICYFSSMAGAKGAKAKKAEMKRM